MATGAFFHTKILGGLISALLSLVVNIQATLAEDLAVVVNPALDIDSLNKKDVVNIFMGRRHTLDQNTIAMPIDLDDDTQLRTAFYMSLTNRDLAEINSYWARLLFSGKSSPPLKVQSAEAVLKMVSEQKTAIGYLPISLVDQRIKVIYTLQVPEQ